MKSEGGWDSESPILWKPKAIRTPIKIPLKSFINSDQLGEIATPSSLWASPPTPLPQPSTRPLGEGKGRGGREEEEEGKGCWQEFDEARPPL